MTFGRERFGREENGGEVTVHVPWGSATFKRTGRTTAELVVHDTVPGFRAAVDGELPDVVDRLCEEEVVHHIATFRRLHAALMQQLSHEGLGTSTQTRTNWSFDRDWHRNGDTFAVEGSEFETHSRLRTNDERTADAALASAELWNMLSARIEGIRSLYKNIARDAQAQAS